MTTETTTAAEAAAHVDDQAAPVAPETAAAEQTATQKKGAKTAEPPTPFDSEEPTPKKKAKGAKRSAKPGKGKATKAKPTKPAKKEPKPAKKDRAPRAETKGAKLLAMIARPKGASLDELMTELSWQAHSIRGFISIAGKKGTKIESTKNEAGERIYKSGK